MDIWSHIAMGVGGTLGLGLLAAAARRGRAEIDPFTSAQRFRYPAAIRHVFLGTLVICPALVTAFLTQVPMRDAGDLWGASAMYALFIGLTAPLWWESSRFAIAADPRGVDCISPWRARQFFRWGEIESIDFSIPCQWFVICTRGRRKFRVPMFVAGLSDFLAICEANLPIGAFWGADEGYRLVGRPFPRRRDGA